MAANRKPGSRGSDKILAAWKARALTEQSVGEIAQALAKSPATVEAADVIGGANATGVRVALRYDGDDGPWCGNDILFWLKWLQTYGGGVVKPPRIIINGTPYPDLVRMELDFGHVEAPQELPGELAAGGIKG